LSLFPVLDYEARLGKLKGLFGGGGDQELLETDVDEAAPKDEKMEKDKKDKATKPLGKDQSTIPLEIEIVYNSQGPLSLVAKRAARERYVCIVCAHKTDLGHAATVSGH
jgi:hypothetical protein